MGTYLYIGRLIPSEKWKEAKAIDDYIIFSDNKFFLQKNISGTGKVYNLPLEIDPFKNEHWKMYDYLHKELVLINHTKADECIEKLGKDFLMYEQWLNVLQREYCFKAVVDWDYKLSSLSKYSIDFDDLNIILTEKDIDLIVSDIDKERCEDEEEYQYWLDYFDKIKQEIKSGETIYRL